MIKTSIKISKDGPKWAIFVKLKNKFNNNKLFRIFFLIAIIFVVIALVVVVYVCLQPVKINTQKTDNVALNTVTFSTDNPSEETPPSDYVWSGLPSDPKYIKIPTVGIEGYIQNVGIDQNSQIAVPNNVHFGGWFIDTVRPGETGLSIIDGHLNGTSKGGIFRNLINVKKDDEFQVEMGDGTVKLFKVLDVQTVDLADSPDVLFSQLLGIKSQLNLITCGGNYNKEQRFYEQRVIVLSEYIGL
jgi:LPXTG-site transpeptidase (sortase) family protein